MAELKGTKTEKNLMEAFAGESMARNKYTYFASKAKKDGYQQIAAIFEETAANEKEHAKLWFKLLCGGAIPSTEENLVAVKTTSGRICTRVWLRRRTPRALRISRSFSAESEQSKRSTRHATSSCWTMCAAEAFLQSARKSFGSAATVGTSTRVPKRPKAARHARIRRAISS